MGHPAIMGFYIDMPTAVMSIRYPHGGSLSTITVTAGEYCSQTLAAAIETQLKAVHSGFSFSIDSDGRYVMSHGSTAFDVVGVTDEWSSVIGDYTASNVTTSGTDLNIDARTTLLPGGSLRYDEHALKMQSVVNMDHNGRLDGRKRSQSGYKRIWNVTFIGEPGTERVTDTATGEGFASLFASGVKFRIYLNWTDELSAWSTSSQDGYVDLVTYGTNNINQSFQNTVQRRPQVTFKGLQV